MSTFSYGQLEGLWINAGGSPALAPIMAAIALGESGGDPNATNKTDNNGKQTSWGLWQLSDGTHDQPVPGILEPETNAEQAVKKYKSQGLQAWGVYTSGKYKQFLKSGVSPITSGLPTGSTSVANGQDAGVIGDVGGAIGSGLASAFSSIFKPFIEIMIWGAEAFIGGALMVAGVLIVVSNSQTGKQVQAKAEKTAMMVAAPEAAPELEAAEGAAASQAAPEEAAPKAFASSGPKVSSWGDKGKPRIAHSKSEFQQMRKSGYTGPVRHEYGEGDKGA